MALGDANYFFFGHKPMGVLSKEWFETQGSRFRAAKSVFLYLEISQHIKEGYGLDGFQKDNNIMDKNTLDVSNFFVCWVQWTGKFTGVPDSKIVSPNELLNSGDPFPLPQNMLFLH